MKRKWIIAAILSLLAIVSIAIVIVLNRNDSIPLGTGPVSITDDCWSHVTNMTFVEQGGGTVEVTLTAPDYVSLVKLLTIKNGDTITGEHITRAVKSNPETVKEYTFTASSSVETDIKNALMEQISYELVALTLEDMIGG